MYVFLIPFFCFDTERSFTKLFVVIAIAPLSVSMVDRLLIKFTFNINLSFFIFIGPVGADLDVTLGFACRGLLGRGLGLDLTVYNATQGRAQ